jgi:hypothetical protein
MALSSSNRVREIHRSVGRLPAAARPETHTLDGGLNELGPTTTGSAYRAGLDVAIDEDEAGGPYTSRTAGTAPGSTRGERVRRAVAIGSGCGLMVFGGLTAYRSAHEA